MTTATYSDLPGLVARMTGDEKHDPASNSTLDVLWVLYDRVLRVPVDAPDDPDRDRFLLSKGHGPMSYYAVLAARGFLDPAQLDGWGDYDSRLGRHPDRKLLPGVEISSGSLGHGLPLAVGVTLGLRAQGRTRPRVVVLVGDAELDEGSNQEAIAMAGRFGLERLTVIVVDNSSATYGWPDGIERRFAVEDWETVTVDGRNHDRLEKAFATPHEGRPLAVVAVIESKEIA